MLTDFEIPIGNPVIMVLAMKEYGAEFSVIVPEKDNDGQGKGKSKKTDGERTGGRGDV